MFSIARSGPGGHPAAVIELVKEAWEWTRENGWMLFLATVAAYAQLHYDLYGPPAHLVVLPGLALSIFLVLPLWAAIVHDTHDRVAHTLAGVAVAVAMGPALVWAYAPGAKEAFKADATPIAVGAVVGTALILAAAVRGRLSFAAWGLGKGDLGWWVRPVGLLLALIVVFVPLTAMAFPEFVEFYPRYKPARTDVLALARYELAMGVYMLTWEFFFRGFMLFGLARTLGPVAAIVIQAFPFFLLHHQKPEPELISSWFGGLLMGWLCWRARCMWPSFLLHWPLYMSMELSAFVLRRFAA